MYAAAGLTLVDHTVIVAYLIGTMILGLWIGRRLKTGKDFFLAGRSLPWWAIGTSLVATDIGGTDIIGVGGAAYTHGIAVANFEWIGCVPAMIVASFVFSGCGPPSFPRDMRSAQHRQSRLRPSLPRTSR